MAKRRARVRYYEDTAGEWRWSYFAGNGKRTADSAEGYDRLSGARRGFASLGVAHPLKVEVARRDGSVTVELVD